MDYQVLIAGTCRAYLSVSVMTLALMCFSGCSPDDGNSGASRDAHNYMSNSEHSGERDSEVSVDDAISIAIEEHLRRGGSEEVTASVSRTTNLGYWVTITRKPAVPGGHSEVLVTRDGDVAEFVGGL